MNKKNYNYEVNRLSEEIKNWYYNSPYKSINVITHPYNRLDLFNDIIKDILINRDKVLYIGKDSHRIKDYNLIYGVNDECLSLKNIKDISNIKEKYDLVIYDDITEFSTDSRTKILEKMEWIYNKGQKIIVYSIEKIFYNTPILELYSLSNRSVLVEPRVITTRVNVEDEIPYLFYDYIKWFYKNDRKVIFYVETDDEREKRYRNYRKVLNESLGMEVLKFNSTKDNKEDIEKKINNSKKGILIISDLKRKELIRAENMDIIMILNKGSLIGYKELLYFCGIVSKYNNKFGEVILVCNEDQDKIDKVKSIAREFNKKLWEKGFLKF